MSGLWTITVPEATTNYVLNPSAESDGNTAAHNDATILRSLLFARVGVYSHAISAGGPKTDFGIIFALSALADAVHTVSFYIRSTSVELKASLDATNFNVCTATTVAASGWIRYTVTIDAGEANGSTSLIIQSSTDGGTLYIDGVQVEEKAYATTYIDGSLPGGRWSGLVDGSASSRDSQYRLGGREVDLELTYSVKVLTMSGVGMPVITNNLYQESAQSEQVFQSYAVLPRMIDLLISTQVSITDAFSTGHTRRKNLIALLAPDQYRGAQPVRIGYTGASSTRTVYGEYRYDGGLEFQAMQGFNEKIPVRLLAVNPMLYEDTQDQVALNCANSLADNNYAAYRHDGLWSNLGTGFDNVVTGIAVDEYRGRVYVCGAFTTANGVTVNGVTYWNGATFIAMGATPGIAGGSAIVYAMAVAPNGDLWIGGNFTSAGGETADGLAMFSIGGVWTGYANGTPGDVINSLAIDKNGLVYFGGTFLDWDGNAASDYIASFNGSVFAPLLVGLNGAVYALAIGADGTTLYLGGAFTAPQTRIMSWNGTAFSAMGSGASGTVWTLAVDAAGMLYAGGAFAATPTTSYIAIWTGSYWSELNGGVNATVYSISVLKDGRLFVTGQFTTAGGIAMLDRMAFYNGSIWYNVDIDTPGTAIINAGREYAEDLFIGYTTTGTATTAAQTTVTTTSSTKTYPVITMIAASFASLYEIENQTTDQALYFDLTFSPGEIITIDLRPGVKTVTSNWRGRIYGQPFSNSDRDAFYLQPGANVISALITGTVECVINWRPTFWSVDGVA